MKSWKRKWKNQLDSIIPELNDKVKNCEINITESADCTTTFFDKAKAWVANRKKRFFGGVAIAFACVLALCFTLPSMLNGGSEFAVILEVNPKVAFSTDKKGKVVSVVSLNGDADVILADDARSQEMLGKSVQEAARVFVDYSAKLGYVDLSSNSAVKISGVGSQKKLDGVKNSLETYFCDKGGYLAVVEESLDKREFCLQTQLEPTESLNAIIDKLSSFNKLYSARIDGNALQELYGETVSLVSVLQSVRKDFNDYCDLIDKIYELNDKIEGHKDNPAILSKNYWYLIDKYEDFSPELKSLCNEMSIKLDLCEKRFGKKIESILDLPSKTLLGALKNLINSETLAEIISKIDSFNEVGFNLTVLENLSKTPKTLDEYVNKVTDYFSSRINLFAERYSAFRQKISKKDYKNYIEQLTQKYGSLENYWTVLKNN